MAQRISRAKRTIGGSGSTQPGDLRDVLRVLYLIFNEGYTGEVDLAAEAIRLTRQLATASDEPEVAGLLALMLLHHARRAPAGPPTARSCRWPSRTGRSGTPASIAEGVEILQAALARDRLGEYQAQAAIAALHCDAAVAEETDWTQILEWYDELLRLTDSPVVALNRAVAVGEADGAARRPARARGRARRRCPGAPPRWPPGCTSAPATRPRRRTLYAAAAAQATSEAERHHLTRQAARLRDA